MRYLPSLTDEMLICSTIWMNQDNILLNKDVDTKGQITYEALP